MSEIDLGQAVGHQEPDIPVSWNQRDLILYAIGIGAKKDDFALVNDKSWAPFPTYPVVLMFKGDSQEVNDFRSRMNSNRIPGLPKLDPNRIVHATQTVQVLKPLPAVSGPGWKISRRVVAVSENKLGIVVESEYVLLDPNGTPYTKLYSSSFNLGAKGTGGKFTKRIAGAPQAKAIPKDRKADWVIQDRTTPEQAITYRLSGDYNALHIDPRIGEASGFGGVILHGLSTFGFGARAVVSAVGGGDPSSLKYFGVRFTSPVKPGDGVETSVWEVGPGPEGTTEVTFVTKNLRTGKVCLGGGVAYVKKSERSKL